MSLNGILKKHPVFGASPKLVGALSKLISILFLKVKKVPKFVRSGGDPLAQLDFDTFFILTTFKTEILCVWGVLGFLP